MRYSIEADFIELAQFNKTPHRSNRNSSIPYSSEKVTEFIDANERKCNEMVDETLAALGIIDCAN